MMPQFCSYKSGFAKYYNSVNTMDFGKNKLSICCFSHSNENLILVNPNISEHLSHVLQIVLIKKEWLEASNNFELFWNEVPLALGLKFDDFKHGRGRGGFPTHAGEIA